MYNHIGEHIYGYNLHGDSFYIIDFGEIIDYRDEFFVTTQTWVCDLNLLPNGQLSFSINGVLVKFIKRFVKNMVHFNISCWYTKAVVKSIIMLYKLWKKESIDIRNYY